jgi:hypothetical protein
MKILILCVSLPGKQSYPTIEDLVEGEKEQLCHFPAPREQRTLFADDPWETDAVDAGYYEQHGKSNPRSSN